MKISWYVCGASKNILFKAVDRECVGQMIVYLAFSARPSSDFKRERRRRREEFDG